MEETNAVDNKPVVYSRHIFCFPFQWRTGGSNTAESERPGLDSMLEAVKAAGHWTDGTYDRTKNYSAYNYLHDFAHNAVFQHTDKEKSAVFNYLYPSKLDFKLFVHKSAMPSGIPNRFPDKNHPNDVLFRLKFFMARLNVYETGVGLLCLFMDNFDHPSPEEVLVINDLARRLFPPHINFNTGIQKPQEEGVLPVAIELGEWKETWPDYPKGDHKIAPPDHYLPQSILGLMGPKFTVKGGSQVGSDKIEIHPALDDRMFLISLIIDEALGAELGNKKDSPSAYLTSDFWYSYIFADRGKPQVENKAMQQDLVQNATYARWSEDSTLFGASRYSFVAIGKGWLKTPMTENYFRLASLCLAQRASALRFREEAAAIAMRIADNEQINVLGRDIRHLYGEYIRFVNRFNFSEASPAEQGIDLYDLIRRQLRVAEQVDSLKVELEEMNAYAVLLQEERRLKQEEHRSKTLDFLAVTGAAFLLPSLILAYFGFHDTWRASLSNHPLAIALMMVGGSALAFAGYYWRIWQKKGWQLVLAVAVILCYLWFLIAMPHFAEWHWWEGAFR